MTVLAPRGSRAVVSDAPESAPAAPSEDRRLRLQLQNRREQLGVAQQQLSAFLARHQIGAKTLFAAELVLEELLANFVSHAFDDGQAHTMELQVQLRPGEVELQFSDDGRAFDPTAQPDPERPASIEQARPGGLGLMLVRRWACRTEYRREAGRNHVTVVIANPAPPVPGQEASGLRPDEPGS